MGPPNSTGPIRESEAISKKYFATVGFGFGILLIPQKPIRQSEAEFIKCFANFGFVFGFCFNSTHKRYVYICIYIFIYFGSV